MKMLLFGISAADTMRKEIRLDLDERNEMMI